MKVLFIGSNPGRNSVAYHAFYTNTKSRQVLDSWITIASKDIDFTHTFHNVSPFPTSNNRPLTMKEINKELPIISSQINHVIKPDKIVALGKTAATAMKLAGFDFYEMPHPSGLNRQLNDPAFVQEKINGLKNYLKSI